MTRITTDALFCRFGLLNCILVAYHQFLHPESLPGPELDRLLALGWYRMHQFIFTTTHLVREEIHRVHWLRYRIDELNSRGSHRKLINRNKSFLHTIEKLHEIPDNHEALYRRYRQMIDFEGAATIRHGLFGEEGVDKGVYDTHFISIFDHDKLIAGGYFDVGQRAGASILHFYDPDYKKYGLGKYLILMTLDFLKSNGYADYYPGYVVAGDGKMNYKLFLGREIAEYYDVEHLEWRRFDERILNPEQLTPLEQLELLQALGFQVIPDPTGLT